MKKFFYFLFFAFSFLLLIYVALPNPTFPIPPDDSIQSREPADVEDSLRRAYFTNFTRREVMAWYRQQFGGYVLNHPPEDAQIKIRDQTRSTFLEEIVHPFRESVYVNGFEPKTAKDAINVDGRAWRQKIIVKYVPSNRLVRLVVSLLTIAVGWLVIKNI